MRGRAARRDRPRVLRRGMACLHGAYGVRQGTAGRRTVVSRRS